LSLRDPGNPEGIGRATRGQVSFIVERD
jgi:hypothetical protein